MSALEFAVQNMNHHVDLDFNLPLSSVGSLTKIFRVGLGLSVRPDLDTYLGGDADTGSGASTGGVTLGCPNLDTRSISNLG